MIAWRRFGGIKATILTVIGSYALLLIIPGTIVAGFTAQYIALFALGMLSAAIAYDPYFQKSVAWLKRVPYHWIASSLLVAVSAFCLGLGWKNAGKYIAYLDLPIGLSVCCLLIAGSNPKLNGLQKILSLKPLVFIGGFSYSLYLIHFPSVTILCKYFFLPLHLSDMGLFLLLLVVGMPIVLITSYLFFLVCELPMMKKAKAM